MSRDALLFLEDIAEACERVTRYCSGLTQEEFVADEKTYDAVTRNLEVIGEAAKRIPEELRRRHPSVDWRRVAGLRDVIAHGYFALEAEMLWNIATEHVPALLQQVRGILEDASRAGE